MTPELQARWDALTEQQRDTVLDKRREWNVDHDWWDGIYDDFIARMTNVGIEMDNRGIGGKVTQPCVYFSGFSSQGDGACFEGEVKDWRLFIPTLGEKYQPLLAHRLSIDTRRFGCTHTGRYYHSQSVTYFDEFEVSNNYENGTVRWYAQDSLLKSLDALWREFVEDAETKFREHMDQLYSDLEKEYDYQTSDEAVLEALDASDALIEEIDKLQLEEETDES